MNTDPGNLQTQQESSGPLCEPGAALSDRMPGSLSSRFALGLRRMLGRLYARHQIAHNIRLLDHPKQEAQYRAREQLWHADRDLCRTLLRRVAFRQRSHVALEAAKLLVQMGDSQGIYALLSQFADRFMNAMFSRELRKALQEVGSGRIVEVLDICLVRIEQKSPLPRDDWSLSLSVYAINALQALNARVSDTLWRRTLAVNVPGFDDLRTCRMVVPIHAETPLDDWRIGSTIAAVRRAAVDGLLTLNRQKAFELLRDALAHSDLPVQLTAIYGLRRLRDSRAYVLLQPVAVDRRHPLSRDARRAIEALGSRQPDALTLVRASSVSASTPAELLRPAVESAESQPESLLRPVSKEGSEVRRD